MDFVRQDQILNWRKAAAWPVTLIGCGGIGSTVGPDLPLMGFRNITVIDGDLVALHNLSNQPAFTERDVGKNKARMLARQLRQRGAKVVVHQCMFDPAIHKRLLEGIVVVAVDSMERVGNRPRGRREIWEAVRANVGRVPFFVDGRLGGEMFDCYTFAPSNFAAATMYEQRALFKQSKASHDPCTQGAIIYATRALAAVMKYQIAAWLRREHAPWRVVQDFKLMGNADASPIIREFL